MRIFGDAGNVGVVGNSEITEVWVDGEPILVLNMPPDTFAEMVNNYTPFEMGE